MFNLLKFGFSVCAMIFAIFCLHITFASESSYFIFHIKNVLEKPIMYLLIGHIIFLIFLVVRTNEKQNIYNIYSLVISICSAILLFSI